MRAEHGPYARQSCDRDGKGNGDFDRQSSRAKSCPSFFGERSSLWRGDGVAEVWGERNFAGGPERRVTQAAGDRDLRQAEFPIAGLRRCSFFIAFAGTELGWRLVKDLFARRRGSSLFETMDVVKEGVLTRREPLRKFFHAFFQRLADLPWVLRIAHGLPAESRTCHQTPHRDALKSGGGEVAISSEPHLLRLGVLTTLVERAELATEDGATAVARAGGCSVAAGGSTGEFTAGASSEGATIGVPTSNVCPDALRCGVCVSVRCFACPVHEEGGERYSQCEHENGAGDALNNASRTQRFQPRQARCALWT